jgi:hypothetical protein
VPKAPPVPHAAVDPKGFDDELERARRTEEAERLETAHEELTPLVETGPPPVSPAYRNGLKRISRCFLTGISVLVGLASADIGAALCDGVEEAAEPLSDVLIDWTLGRGGKLVASLSVVAALTQRALDRKAAHLRFLAQHQEQEASSPPSQSRETVTLALPATR